MPTLVSVEVSTHKSAPVSCDSLCFPVCLLSLRGSHFSCVLLSLTDPKRVDDFSVCSTFYLLFEWNDDFKASNMQNQKLGLDNLFKRQLPVLFLCPKIYPESVHLFSFSTVMNLDQAIIYFLEQYCGFLIDASTSVGLTLISFSHCGKNNLA